MNTPDRHSVRNSLVRQRQRGVAMFEALIAMLLIAIWMLATAGLQISSYKFQKSAGNRFLAVALAGELAESIESNLGGANANAYVMAATNTPTTATTDCTASHCTPAQLANFDLAQWTARVSAALPLQQVSVGSAAGAGGLLTYTINISWNEPRGRQAYASTGTAETLSYVLTKVVRDAGT
jgi:type IV pilus assembly protein PilV